MHEQELITGVLKREGWDKYTDHPADRGGPTKWGITLMAWAEDLRRPPAKVPGTNDKQMYSGQMVTTSEIAAITEAQAREFYGRKYIVGPNFDKIIDEQLRELLIDAGVNHGQETAARWVQQAVHVTDDGKLGPVSLAAINQADALALFLWVCALRVRLYGRLTSRDPVLQKAKEAGFRLQAENTSGWCNRSAEFLETQARRIEADHNRRI